MSLNEELRVPIQLILQQEVLIKKVRPVGGGSISNTYAVETDNGAYFLKANHDAKAMAMFQAEGDGLKTLKSNSQFAIPEVFGAVNTGGTSYLLMELIEPVERSISYWDDLGQNLATLHKVSQGSFGYHRTNYIGSLPQTNESFSSWAEFFIHERMNPMIRIALDHGLVDAGFVKNFDSAMPKIVAEMPEEAPALLHGDLWSGNLMVDNHGNATIIDPAVYYGHREMDLAFTQMFGGFADQFIRAYDEFFPLEPGFSKRIGLYNLYPYLVHLNLFGRSYFGHIDHTIRQFT